MNAEHTTRLAGALDAVKTALIHDGLPASAAQRIVEMVDAMTISEAQLERALHAQAERYEQQLRDVRSQLTSEFASLRTEMSKDISTLKVNQAGLAFKVAAALLGMTGALVGVAAGIVQLLKTLGYV